MGIQNPKIRYHLGQVYMKRGNPSKARETFKRALILDPNFDKADEIQEILNY